MGIIPARAGFTKCALTLKFCVGDHPRSRGVYGVLFHCTRANRGIIPARAGFTSPRSPRSPLSPDHPRSRGVYW